MENIQCNYPWGIQSSDEAAVPFFMFTKMFQGCLLDSAQLYVNWRKLNPGANMFVSEFLEVCHVPCFYKCVNLDKLIHLSKSKFLPP